MENLLPCIVNHLASRIYIIHTLSQSKSDVISESMLVVKGRPNKFLNIKKKQQ